MATNLETISEQTTMAELATEGEGHGVEPITDFYEWCEMVKLTEDTLKRLVESEGGFDE